MESDELKKEEFEALEAIYSTELTLSNNSVSVKLSSCNDTKQHFLVNLEFDLPPGLYPLEAGPSNVAISAPWMSSDEKHSILGLIHSQIRENIGQSMIYTLVEGTRTEVELLISKKLEQEALSKTNNDSMESGRRSSSSESDDDTNAPDIFHGEYIKDRKSTFQAHLARVNSVHEAMAVIDYLKQKRKIAIATHNMWAYRIVEDGIEVPRSDCDDDGETQAGSKLLQLLKNVDAKGVIVIVSRWYGGIHLGPDRFKHIKNAAREVLTQNGFIHN